MSVDSDKQNTLISDWLDNRLSDEERLEFDTLMADSVDFARSAAASKSISATFQQLPARTLPASFASATVKRAQLAAHAETETTSHVVSESKSIRSRTADDLPRKSRRAMYVGLALAACLLFVVGPAIWLAIPNSDRVATETLPRTASDFEDTPTNATSGPSGDVIARDNAALDAAPNTVGNRRSPAADLSSADGSSSNKNAAAPPATRTNAVEMVDNENPPALRTDGADQIAIANANDADVPPAMEELTDEERLLMQLESGELSNFLMVVDVSLDQQAWEDEALFSVFDRHAITTGRPVKIDSQLGESLSESRIVAQIDGALPANSQDGELVSLVFVKARSDRLDMAIRDIYGRFEEFPTFAIDMAFDPPAQESLKRLKSMRYAGEQVDGFARVLSVTENPGAGLVGNFRAAKPRGKNQPIADRKAGWPEAEMTLTNDDMNPVSYVLFVVRRSAK
jgi:hypothetical protein